MKKNKYSIIILSGGLPFNGNSLNTGSIGGSETGVIYLAKGLAARGHQVAVFCNCAESAGDFDGVTYFDLSRWEELGSFLTVDILMVSRHCQRLIDKCKAKSIYYYCQDVMPASDNVHNLLWQTDRIGLLSPYQRNLWQSVEPRYDPHIFEVRNGVDLELVRKAKDYHKKNPMVDPGRVNFVYTSRPERGLLYLLKMWPEILKRVPNAYLVVLSYDTGGKVAAPEVRDIMDRCAAAIAAYPGSIQRKEGGLRKFDLYRLLHGCNALLYPCGFPEISCISAIEAMATDTLVITTNDFALVDTVGKDCGVLIDGEAWQKQYQADFIDAAVKVAETSDFDLLVSRAKRKVESFYSWGHVVDLWTNEFDTFFESRRDNNTEAIVKNFLYHDDVINALTLSKEKGFSGLESECNSRLSEIDVPGLTPPNLNHSYPGKSPKAMTINSLLRSYPGGVKPSKLLNIESGQGDLSAFLCKSHPTIIVTGIDKNELCIKESRHFYLVSEQSPLSPEEQSRLHYLKSDYRDITNFKYDVVVSDCVADKSRDIKKEINHLESLTRNGGLILMVTKDGPWEAGEVRYDSGYTCQRLYNLEIEDLKDLLKNKDGYTSQYVTYGLNDRDELLAYWITAWVKNPAKPTGTINLERKLKTFRPYKGISLCMIAKDEEDNISKCLKSVKNIVDQVVFVDTGSKDDTVSIVRNLIPDNRLVVVDHPWKEDFSEARNAVFPHVANDWILWLDCDEELLNAERVPKYLNSVIFPAFILRQHHLMLDGEFKPDSPIRLFKNLGPKWFGVIHEQVEVKMDEPVRPIIYIQDANIAHYGYVDEVTRKNKCSNRNMKLLYKDRKVNPERRLGKFLLAREYRNIIKWGLAESLKTHTGISDEMVIMMRDICAIHLNNFTDRDDPIYKYSFAVYQETLGMMKQLGVKVRDDIMGDGIAVVPFLFRSRTKEDEVDTKHIYFLSESEYLDFCKYYLKEITD